MIIILKKDVPQKKVDDFIQSWKDRGFGIHLSKGESTTIVGLLGDTSKIEAETVAANDVVETVQRVSAPYKMASRSFHPQNTVIEVGSGQKGIDPCSIGGDIISVIAGPCSVESEDQIVEIAKEVKKSGARLLRGGAFKPRTSPYSFQGLGKQGIEFLINAKKETGLPVVTELMDARQLQYFDDVDIIQIGARNMQNFDLLKELGKTDKPILLKRGLCATVKEFLMSAEYIMASGNENIILCERGIRTFDNYTRNCLDISIIPYLKHVTHLPVVIDPSHACGTRWMIPTLSQTAVAAGCDGLEIEVHNHPDKALSDGEQALLPDAFDDMMKKLQKYAAIENRKV
ncbi:3-deoxy-7-phosphoheptulonate synthase [Treponema parvum]|uniref:3-deoxy-7-phosphoheptulonate synthase n=1 Tax=Treponema parvum TaxID=138851 RepID=A0A975F5F3_9SPIR|nr:3-deoxy-7-phosphoheptulonate synthase [Treponema parvum]QTQ14732.1 3-deoxy-7-phosphoheptulonate synthase [Treponema parvum]